MISLRKAACFVLRRIQLFLPPKTALQFYSLASDQSGFDVCSFVPLLAVSLVESSQAVLNLKNVCKLLLQDRQIFASGGKVYLVST
ncbi:MAG: hypothetical protein FJ267_11680 [Planctomycetes bacterium]|nr:hypothetical protein [Planctomycetota bacterium]